MKYARAVKRHTREFVIRRGQLDRTDAFAACVRSFGIVPRDGYPCYWYTSDRNLGDILSPIISRQILGVEPVPVSRHYSGKLLGLGSILEACKSGDHVWGSGLIRARRIEGSGVSFAAVRGPRTRRMIDGDIPERYGDPGILLPMIYSPSTPDKRSSVGIVPHYADQGIVTHTDPEVRMIDVAQSDWRLAVDAIAACDIIVSSSLHGIVFAEAYGIPAVWIQPTNRIVGGDFKFHDYYEGTGREAELVDWSRGLKHVASKARSPVELDAEPLLAAGRDIVHQIAGPTRVDRTEERP